MKQMKNLRMTLTAAILATAMSVGAPAAALAAEPGDAAFQQETENQQADTIVPYVEEQETETISAGQENETAEPETSSEESEQNREEKEIFRPSMQSKAYVSTSETYTLRKAKDGTWYYSDDNWNIDTDYTGLAQVNGKGAWYYVQNGCIDWKANLLVRNAQGIWCYVKDGKLDQTFSGLFKQDGTWYYVQNGKVNESYTNLVKYNGSWYYVRNGKINWEDNTLARVNNTGTWYRVQKARIDWDYTGLQKYGSTWYYIGNGKVDWSYTGLVKYGGTWYYVQNGVLHWGITNLIKYGGTWYYVHNSKVDWGATTLARVNNKGTWYGVRNGRIDWNYTGLIKYSGKLYYIQNGKWNKSYNGRVNYGNKTYLVSAGIVVGDVLTANGSYYSYLLSRYQGNLIDEYSNVVELDSKTVFSEGEGYYDGTVYNISFDSNLLIVKGSFTYLSDRDHDNTHTSYPNKAYGFIVNSDTLYFIPGGYDSVSKTKFMSYLKNNMNSDDEINIYVHNGIVSDVQVY